MLSSAPRLSVCILAIALAGCGGNEDASDEMTQPGVDFGEVIHTARSVDGCHSYLEIEFYDGAQYAATYSSDVGPINLIYYAGQYLMGDDYFFLSSPLFGTISFNADDEGIYMPEGYSVDQGLNSGMRMKFE